MSVASGTTCAFLGDGRDIREPLVAANAVESLRKAGHIVHFFLFDDNLEPLRLAQLRIAVKKDPALIEKYAVHCGKPLALVPCPFSENESYSQYFQRKYIKRLNALGCQPNLISSSILYTNGAFLPYIEQILGNSTDIAQFLRVQFPDYSMERLFNPICRKCGRIDSTTLEDYSRNSATVFCASCGSRDTMEKFELRGKLSWKVDLALRWWVFNIDVEPFSKKYLEPNSGSFAISLSLARRFFGHVDVSAILVGMVMQENTSYSPFLDSLPSQTVVKMFTDRWGADLRLTNERLVLEAGRSTVYEGESFLNVVKRHVPLWALNPLKQSPEVYDLLRKGQRFAVNYLNEELGDDSIQLSKLAEADDLELEAMILVLGHTLGIRSQSLSYDEFDELIRPVTQNSGRAWSGATIVLRNILCQTRGLPGRRLLYHLPLGVLESIRASATWLLSARKAGVSIGGPLLL